MYFFVEGFFKQINKTISFFYKMLLFFLTNCPTIMFNQVLLSKRGVFFFQRMTVLQSHRKSSQQHNISITTLCASARPYSMLQSFNLSAQQIDVSALSSLALNVDGKYIRIHPFQYITGFIVALRFSRVQEGVN